MRQPSSSAAKKTAYAAAPAKDHPTASARTAVVTTRTQTPSDQVSVGARALVENYRLFGFRRALINPLDEAVRDSWNLPELEAATYGLALNDSAQYAVEFAGESRRFAVPELLSRLRASYCGSLAFDCAHVRSAEQRRWLYARAEAAAEAGVADAQAQRRILAQLVDVERFEQRHRADHSAYKQFSLEGSETLATLLTTVIRRAAEHNVEQLVLGMPHRGRLNLMLNVLGVPAPRMLSLFSAEPDARLAAWDLKDHAGYSAKLDLPGGPIDILLAHNPSHLESVSPVVCGMARALEDRTVDGSRKKVMPILVHGDASFCAQGIVAETLNLSQTRGYGVGGTVHLILNNQIGSTISHPGDARSTLFCADSARSIDAPIIHVNADDPEAVVAAATIAADYRTAFGADIVIDHVGYRRCGHFVGDDATYTQPAMYRRIERHPRVTEIYAAKLTRRGVIGDSYGNAVGHLSAPVAADGSLPADRAVDPDAAETSEGQTSAAHERRVNTAVPVDQLRAITLKLATPPADFDVHPAIGKMQDEWRVIAEGGDRPVDWRLAENLAYATLLTNGFNVRLSGLDVGRGTFVHRQHVWHDQAAGKDGESHYVPLRHINGAQGSFAIFESPLSEEAVVGFEYGYSLQCGRDLVVWEAQFGDFVNNAQVIIDQYIASGEAKWGYHSGLVCMLPHGHDGWGPEHSSGFVGRFLQVCAEGNMRVVIPSTAAQMYHLLRSQALSIERKPLIVMTPKPRFYACAPSYSRLKDLAQGYFRPLIGSQSRTDLPCDPARVERVVITSGKLYYDLVEECVKSGIAHVPVLRIEQLYPFPSAELAEELRGLTSLRDVVWAQEEAKNHGAWHLIREQLESALPPGVSLSYAGRPASAAAAGASPAMHALEQRAVVVSALASDRR